MDRNTKRAFQLLRAYLGQDCYCVETRSVASVHRWEQTELPGAGFQQRFPGATAALGVGLELLPVYPLAALLGRDAPAASEGPVMVLRSGKHQYGVQVDSVARAVEVDSSEAARLPELARDATGRLRGAIRLGDELTLCLSAARLVPPPPGMAGQPEMPFVEPRQWNTRPPNMEQQKLMCLSEPGGDESMLFAFTLRQMVEIAQGLRIIPVAAANPCIVGVADWRGYLVPVIDPGALLGAFGSGFDFSKMRVAILRGARSHQLFAMPASDVAALPLPMDTGQESVKPLDGLGPYVRAAYQVAGDTLVLPDLDNIRASA